MCTYTECNCTQYMAGVTCVVVSYVSARFSARRGSVAPLLGRFLLHGGRSWAYRCYVRVRPICSSLMQLKLSTPEVITGRGGETTLGKL